MKSYKEATMAERPLKMTYGDDSDFTREELKEYIEAYDAAGLPIKWEPGDVLVICNLRWAHGRPSYQLGPNEQRTLGVVLGPPMDKVGQRNEP